MTPPTSIGQTMDGLKPEMEGTLVATMNNKAPSKAMDKLGPTLGIAFVGYGGIARVHNASLAQIKHIYPNTAPEFAVKAVCMSNLEKAQAVAAKSGGLRCYDSIDRLVADDEIQIIDLVSPNFTHKEVIIAAAQAGKHLICEKPLSLTEDEARQIVDAVRASGITFGMIFNYRFIPAIIKAKELIDAGELGEIYSFRAEYFHTGYQNAERPFNWRMDKARSGGGALVDLGVHVIDLVHFLFGRIASVQGMTKTYITERPLAKGASEKAPVSVDDAAWLNLQLINGARGSLEVSRFATGTLDDLNLIAYGSKGALRFNLMDSSYLYWYNAHKPAAGLGGWTRIEAVQHYPDAVLPNPRSVTGWTRYHVENLYRFLKAVDGGTDFSPNADDGLAAQTVLTAAYASSDSGKWQSVRP